MATRASNYPAELTRVLDTCKADEGWCLNYIRLPYFTIDYEVEMELGDLDFEIPEDHKVAEIENKLLEDSDITYETKKQIIENAVKYKMRNIDNKDINTKGVSLLTQYLNNGSFDSDKNAKLVIEKLYGRYNAKGGYPLLLPIILKKFLQKKLRLEKEKKSRALFDVETQFIKRANMFTSAFANIGIKPYFEEMDAYNKILLTKGVVGTHFENLPKFLDFGRKKNRRKSKKRSNKRSNKRSKRRSKRRLNKNK